MALEAGPWILLSGIPFVAALVRTCRPGTPDAPVRVSTLPPRVFTGGIVAGSLLGPLLAPATTLFPLTSAPADQPLVNGLVAAASVGLVLRALQGVTPRGPGARAGLLVGLSAFALHGCVDFDVYIPGVAILFAATCALLPGTAADSGVRTRLGLGLLATVLLAIPLCSGMLVLRRDALLRELLATGPPRATPKELAAAAGGAVPDLAALRETLRLLDASRQDQEAEALLRGLAPALEERAAVRLTRAEHLLSSARRDPQRAGAAARAITALRVAGDADDPELLYLLSRALEAAGDRPAARAIAKEARAAARAWGLDRTSAPWLDDL
jgi:hypothetical protein